METLGALLSKLKNYTEGKQSLATLTINLKYCVTRSITLFLKKNATKINLKSRKKYIYKHLHTFVSVETQKKP